MSEQDDALSPQRVDASIEQLFSASRSDNASPEQTPLDPNARLVHDLQQLYDSERNRYLQALQRVEDRLMDQRLARVERPAVTLLPSAPKRRHFNSQNNLQGSKNRMENRRLATPRFAKLAQRLSVLAAVLIVAALVGSAVLVLNASHQKTQAGNRTTKALSQPFGLTLTTMPSDQGGYIGFSWSPDGKRVASATDNGVQIWDATTGKHLVNAGLTAAIGTNAVALSWSPNSQILAVTTGWFMVLIDGQTGSTVNKPYEAPLALPNLQGGGSHFSAHLPASGGFARFMGIAWSPDGRFIALSVEGAQGYIQVVNAQTMTLAYSLTPNLNGPQNPGTLAFLGGGDYGPWALVWSPDSQYLAVAVSGTPPLAGNLPDAGQKRSLIWVWNVSTHQVVFKQFGGSSNSNALAFQPRSHNLAFFVSEVNAPSTQLQIWDVTSNRQLKTFPIHSSGALAWSPDGTSIAYAQSNRVIIINASSGQTIHTYEGNQHAVSQLAWSPDGKYIVSGEGLANTNKPMANVWVAQ